MKKFALPSGEGRDCFRKLLQLTNTYNYVNELNKENGRHDSMIALEEKELDTCYNELMIDSYSCRCPDCFSVLLKYLKYLGDSFNSTLTNDLSLHYTRS